MGHIKFWRMASTFTGLKLQGYLGKFGATELTEIADFVYLGPGKLLSTTETGNFLLWDGGFIKCEIMRKGRLPCHSSRIEVLQILEAEIISAGDDGVVRTWDLEAIRNADVQTDENATQGAIQARIFEIDPLEQIEIGKSAKIKSITKHPEKNYHIAQSSDGHLYKVGILENFSVDIYSYPSGPSNVVTNPGMHSILSIGDDGVLRLYNYLEKRLLATRKFSGKGTTMKYMPNVSRLLLLLLVLTFSLWILKMERL
jgi:WD40 repeat protein